MRTAQIALLLPEVMRRSVLPGSALAALLAVMEAQHAPAEAAVASLPGVLDPLVTPSRFVPMLADWVDVGRLDRTPAGRLDPERLRLLVCLAPQLAATRGTEQGLLQVLRIATGGADLRMGDGGPVRSRLVLPASAATQVALVRALVAQEKPAHQVVEVVVAPSPPAGTEGPA